MSTVTVMVCKPASRSSGRDYASHCMDVWATWWAGQSEYGWPSMSSEVVAQQRAQTATRIDGVARWRGKGDPPTMPKESRPAASCRIPKIDPAKLGPEVDRHLRDLDNDEPTLAMALKIHHLGPSLTAEQRARHLRLSVRAYYTAYRSGLLWLAGRLTRR